MPDVPVWAVDAPEIDGNVWLLRRIPEMLCRDGIFESSNFDERAAGEGLSVTLWETNADLEDVLRGHVDFGVACVPAAAFRAEGCIIARRPLVGNLNHCEIYPRISRKGLKRVKSAARWAYYPEWVESEHRLPVQTLS
jgi:hypothetical protein